MKSCIMKRLNSVWFISSPVDLLVFQNLENFEEE